METRANFILVGLFTILALLGSMVFFVWLASVQVDRQYKQYGILFDNVSGLDPFGDVLFNGVGVGRVTRIQIWAEDPSKVFVAVEIDAATPIRTDTVAQLKSQGVTGVSYIELAGGAPDAPVLQGIDGAVPIIQAERSTVQAIVEDAPALLTDVSEILGQLQALTSPENQDLVAGILRNVEASSARLDGALTDFSEISSTVREATEQITAFTNRLDQIGASVDETLDTANTTLEAARSAFAEADGVLIGASDVIESARSAFASTDQLMQNQVPQITEQLAAAIATFGGSSQDLFDRIGITADLTNDRLFELETTLNEADAAFAAVTETSVNIDALITGDGGLLVAEARQSLASLQISLSGLETVLQEDVPDIVANVRSMVSTADASLSEITANVGAASDQLAPLIQRAEEALTTATEVFTQSQITLTNLDSALGSAEAAFDGANAILSESLDPAMAEIRASVSRVSELVATFSADAPQVTQDLLALIARSDATISELQRLVASSAPDVRAFAASALPQFGLLAQEARGLVSSLGTLTRRIEQDPAGLILDNRVPDYRR